MKTVKEIMSFVDFSLEPESKLSQAIRFMEKERHSCVLICKEKVPVGIITERDIVGVMARQIHSGRFQDLCVSEVMTCEPVCVVEHTSIQDALILARSRKVRHVPIVDSNESLVGIVTQNDAVAALLSTLESSSRLKEAYQALKVLSLEDPMLGVGNRRALEVDLTHTQATAKRYGKAYSIAMLDVDHFKTYNDYYGHPKGDEALKSVVRIIKDNKRTEDRVYRYGGEEFLVLMPNTNVDQALLVAERIRVKLEEEKLEHKKCKRQVLTASVGVAQSSVTDENVVKHADEALYHAKHSGRNLVASYPLS